MNCPIVIVYVPLLNEGTEVSRPTEARHIAGDQYELLATNGYQESEEEWKFLPGTIVRCKKTDGYLKAYAAATPTPNIT